MLYNNKKRYENIDINECTSRATCSISPTIAALENLAIIFLKHLSFYLLELKDLGVENPQIQNEILNIIASLTSVNEYSENELYVMIQKEYFILEEVKRTYSEVTLSNKIKQKFLKPISDFTEETTLPQAIVLGEKLNLINSKDSETTKLLAILQIVLQSISLNLIGYKNLTDLDKEIFYQVLSSLNILNSPRLSKQMIKSEINKLSVSDINLQILIADEFLKHYGGIQKVKVSHSTRKGKAVLVSGNNFSNLYDILKLTEGKNIDVYSHSNLLIAHAMSEFKKFEHFQGHYGSRTENCILDFATFPGSILMTKNFRNNTEYLYRGRLFSNDYIVPKGVKKVTNNNFLPLIEESVTAKGFSKGKIKEATALGYDENEITEKFRELAYKLKSKELKRLYIIGIDALTERENAYYHEFLNMLDKNEYVISFSYEGKSDNILTINIGNYIPLMSRLLKKLFEYYSITNSNITFFFTTCDVMTLSTEIAISTQGAKNIYMSKCLPTVINPATFSIFRKMYNVKLTESPKQDIENIRKE